jgi:hypothetical protein
MKRIILLISALVLVIALLFLSYSRWNAASPTKTCASCHEITHAVDLWQGSSHRNIACKECHGTALSEGFHSLKEKAAMVFNHKSSNQPEDVKISEIQRLKVMERCEACHQAEYTKWNSGGHSMTYSQVFLDEAHNKTEAIYEDCLRCHGMFFKGTVADIVEPIDMTGPWKMKDASLGDRPSIPCFACHQVHREGVPGAKQKSEKASDMHYSRMKQTLTSFYYRRDSSYFPVTQLMQQPVFFEMKPVKLTNDPLQSLCAGCHSPNVAGISGSGDDRTARGVHEGLSCNACHDPHSNSAVASCKTCHPAISNCKLDVEKMNTTYADRNSSNNIHFVACVDCHAEKRPFLTTKDPKESTKGTQR